MSLGAVLPGISAYKHWLADDQGKLHYAYRSDDNVDILALFHKQCHFSLNELLRHFLRIAASASTLFLHGDFQEFSTE